MSSNYENNKVSKVIHRNKRRSHADKKFYVALPNLPLFGQIKNLDLLKKLLEIIEDEATAVDFYTRLLFDAPNSLHKEFIEEAKDEEAKHLIVFTKLYQLLTNQIPSYTLTPVNYANYKEGLLIALKDELEAADLYKEMILSTNDARIKDAFFYAMGDELEHSVMFSTLYNTV